MLFLKWLRYAAGGVLFAVGLAAMLYGGYLSAIVTDDGGEPFYVQGYVFCIAGLALMGLGAWLCGAELDFHDY